MTAGIAFMGKDWDRDKGGRREWIAWLSSVLVECLRVSKPGSVLLCWALPRTSHWTGTAIEDAGWIIEDRIAHHFGSGFPKHKSKLKPATEDWWLARKPGGAKWLNVDGCRVGFASEDDQHEAFPGGKLTSRKVSGGGLGCGQKDHQRGEFHAERASGRYPPNLLLSHSSLCVRRGTKRANGNGHYLKDRGESGYDGGLHGQAGLTERHLSDETVADYECAEDCPIRLMGEQGGERPSGEKRAHYKRSSAKGWSGAFADDDGGPAFRSFTGGDTGSAARFFPNWPCR